MNVPPADVGTTLGASWSAPIPHGQWGMWIADADMLIQAWAARSGYLYADLDQAMVDYVIREAVAARAKRPDSATQVEVAIDDGRVSKRYESSSGQISILDEWWELLRPAGSTGSAGAFSIKLAFEAGS